MKRTKKVLLVFTDEELGQVSRHMPSWVSRAAWGRLLMTGDPAAIQHVIECLARDRGICLGTRRDTHVHLSSHPSGYVGHAPGQVSDMRRDGGPDTRAPSESDTTTSGSVVVQRSEVVSIEPEQATFDVGYSNEFVERLLPALMAHRPFSELAEEVLATRVAAPLSEDFSARAPLVEAAVKAYQVWWDSLGKKAQAGKRRTKKNGGFAGYLCRGLRTQIGYEEERHRRPDEEVDGNYESLKQEQRWMEERMAERQARKDAEREENDLH